MRATSGQWRPCLMTSLLLAVAMLAVVASGGKRKRFHVGHPEESSRRGSRQERLVVKELRYVLEHYHHFHHGEESHAHSGSHYSDAEAGRGWVERTNRELLNWNHRLAVAEWNYVTNITQHTEEAYVSVIAQQTRWEKRMLAEGRKFKVQGFDPDLQRQFQRLTLSSTPKDPQKTRQISQLSTQLTSTYDTAKVCLPRYTTTTHNQRRDSHQGPQPQPHHRVPQRRHHGCLPLEPDLETKMAESRDPEELLAVWEGWREVAGEPQRERYAQYVELLNQGARDNGFADFSDYWTQNQFPDDTDLEAMTSRLWAELRPLYLELHAYVRGRLRRHYGNETLGAHGTMPAHVLGNMWAQSWSNVFPLVVSPPRPNLASRHDASTSHDKLKDTDQLLKERYRDVQDLFELSERFYVSVGLFPMTGTFWQKSMLEKPKDPKREVRCHASAADMFSEGDFRIKMCSSVTEEYLSTIHHEMGHVEYFMAYQHLPTVYRDAPNQAFHEAIGDTTTLAVMSRTHRQKLGLLLPSEEEKAPAPSSKRVGTVEEGEDVTVEEDVTDLLKMALDKVAFLPFALVVDQWRWKVFRGETTPATYNHDWWKLRLDLQGIVSPVPRSEEDFDPASKMHVAANAPYYCYFVSTILQFQFYQTLCGASGHKGPLHLCDFGGSVKAGTLFKNFMALGASRPWQDALEQFTGSRNVSAKPMLEYFQPLLQWLQRKNKETGESLGWEKATINWKEQI